MIYNRAYLEPVEYVCNSPFSAGFLFPVHWFAKDIGKELLISDCTGCVLIRLIYKGLGYSFLEMYF